MTALLEYLDYLWQEIGQKVMGEGTWLPGPLVPPPLILWARNWYSDTVQWSHTADRLWNQSHLRHTICHAWSAYCM